MIWWRASIGGVIAGTGCYLLELLWSGRMRFMTLVVLGQVLILLAATAMIWVGVSYGTRGLFGRGKHARIDNPASQESDEHRQ